MGIGPYLVAVAFWVFMAAAAVAGIIGSYKRRRIELEPLRSAIERGQQLDPAIIERLMAPPEREQLRIEPLHLRIGSIITIAVGAGLALLAMFWTSVKIFGAGALAACIGIGLLIAARAVEQHQRGQQLHDPASPGQPQP
ncbi:MAG TPA: DUF6249 domain-containing protein [Steroidobacteraceae bacterium]|jgi:hypothetical protein|nr:DUF6249 domain-containing protein [Steroidobacteraceae bacterium]